MKPLDGRVVLVRDDHEKVTKGGIHLPQGIHKGKEGSRLGTVKYIHDDEKTFKVGDRVIFDLYGGNSVNFNDEDVYIIKEEFILAIVS